MAMRHAELAGLLKQLPPIVDPRSAVHEIPLRRPTPARSRSDFGSCYRGRDRRCRRPPAQIRT